ncbi:MAG: TetR/AcrR family transcriptional regulator [Kangiellaceae bacterium]|nr:TetR/AcrR family transcriptional regulator [Kangiellaceae bacterium]
MDGDQAHWLGENDFNLFRSSVPISEQEIWLSFYQLHKDKIQVQKQNVAIEKLKIIIQATFKLSNQKGFTLMSLRDLSRETNMSMGSLYTYIGSKGQLAEMIHQFLPHIFNLCIPDLSNSIKSARERLQRFIRGHVFITECLHDWFFFAFMETKHLSRANKKLAMKNELNSEQWLEKIISDGERLNEFASVDRFLMGLSIKSLLQNWYVKRTTYRQGKVTCEQYIQFIEQMINKMIEKR